MNRIDQIMGDIEKLSAERDTLAAEKHRQELEREVNRLKRETGGGNQALERAVGSEKYDKISHFMGWE